MKRIQKRLAGRVVMGALVLSALGTIALAGGPYAKGEKVEVKDGDSWTPAVVDTRDGDRYRLTFKDGTHEWATQDMLRAVSGDSGSGDATSSKDGVDSAKSEPTPKAPSKPPQKPAPKGDGGSAGTPDKPAKKPDPSSGSYGAAKARDRIAAASGAGRLSGADPGGVSTVDPTGADANTPNEVSTMINGGGPHKPPAASSANDPGSPNTAGAAQNQASRTSRRASSDPGMDPLFQKTDRKSVISVELTDAPSTWSYDSQTQTPRITLRSTTMKESGKKTGFVARAVVVCRSRPELVFVSYTCKNDSGSPSFEVQKLDLSSGDTLGTYILGTEGRVLDANPDGTKILFAPTGAASSKRIEIWSVESADPKKVGVVTPYGSGMGGEVSGAKWIDTNHVITAGARETTLWQIDFDKAAWTAVWAAPWGGAGHDVALSVSPIAPSIAMISDDSIVIAEAHSGKIQGVIKDPYAGSLLLSPSGKMMMGVNTDQVKFWDMKTGKAIGTVDITDGRDPSVLDDRFAMVGGVLFDMNKKAEVWDYTGLNVPGTSKTVWGTASDGRRLMIRGTTPGTDAIVEVVRVPSPAVITAVELGEGKVGTGDLIDGK